MKNSKRIFVMPDTHFAPNGEENGGHDEGAFRTCLKAIEIIRPDEFMHIGDLGEWDSCSAWQFKNKRKPPLDYILERLNVEITAVNHQFDRICAVLDKVGCKKRVFIEGNHETRVARMLAESALAQDHYNIPAILKLRQRGFSFQKYGQFVRRGKLRFYHGGHFSTVHHAYTTALKCGASVLYGDRHSIQTVTVPSVEGPHGGFCIGCLCKLDKEFLMGRQTNWQHGFAVVYMRPSGKFNVEVHRIESGWAIVGDREIMEGRVSAGRPRKEIT